MRLLSRIGLLVLAICFVIVFFIAAFRLANELGVSPLPYVAQDALLVLAGAAGVTACAMKSARLDKQYKLEREAEPFIGNRFESNVSRVTVMVVAGVTLTALWTVYHVLSGGPIERRALVFSAVLLLFALALLSALLGLLRAGKPSLVMDVFALDHAWYGPIRWDQIQGIHLREIRIRGTTRHSLVLLVDRPGRYLMQGPWWLRAFIRPKRRNAASGMIDIPLGALNQPALMTHKAAVALRARVSPPPLGFWVPGMSAEAISVQREMDAAFRRMDEIGQLVEHDVPNPDAIER